MLTLAPNLKLPSEAVTQTFGFFGRKGSGKTYAAGKLVETFLDAQAQCIILDPVGNWFGLRLDKSGKKPSRFNLPILGGENGDVPLQSKAGAVVADFVVSTGSSAVIDVSRFRKGERKEFVTDFAEELFHKKKTSRSPMHLVIEEAQVFAPQKTFKGEERMLGALEDIVRLGRNYGIGASMISQRPQSINTELRNQCEPLVVFQLVAKHERDAIGGWMEHMGVGSELEALSSLQEGECFFWSPAWLKKFIKSRFDSKETFDASATPKLGAKTFSPQKLAPVDLDALQTTMRATIEQAKADDPKELRRHIAELHKQLSSRQPATVDPAAIDRAVTSALAARDREWQATVKDRERVIGEFKGRLGKIESLAHVNGEATPRVDAPAKAASVATPACRPSPMRQSRTESSVEPSDIGRGGLRRMLIALANRPQGLSAQQLGVRAGLSSRSGTFTTYLSTARKAGWIEGGKDRMRITDAGLLALGEFEQLPSGQELLAYWLGELGDSGAARMLRALATAYPRSLSKEELGEAAGLSQSGTFTTYLSTLRRLELIEGRSEVKASDELFAGA